MFYLQLLFASAFIVIVFTIFATIIASTGSPVVGFFIVIATFFVCFAVYQHVTKQ